MSKYASFLHSLLGFLLIFGTLWGCRANRSNPKNVSVFNEAELKEIQKEKDHLAKMIEGLEKKFQKIRERNPGESLDRILIPIDKMGKSVQKEKDLLAAFGASPDSDDLMAMEERLLRQEERVKLIVDQYEKFDRILESLDKRMSHLQSDIQKIKSDHPGTARQELLVPLDNIESNLKAEKDLLLAMDRQASEEDLQSIFERLDEIDEQLDRARKSYRYTRGLDIEFKASTLFTPGQVTLSNRGLRNMNFVAKDIERSIEKYQKRFPGEKMILVLRVNGYADEQAFYLGQKEAERKKQNQEISQKRAETVGDFLNQSLKDQVYKIEKEFIGKGEILPPGVEAGPEDDPDRRICTLSILIYSEEIQG